MRIHHLNCGTFCPLAARLISENGKLFGRGRLVCHCLLLETERDGLVLIDSGFGSADCAQPPRIPLGFRKVSAPKLDAKETAIQQIQALGFQAEDVRHIVLTHLDLDHAGGIADFPDARIHVHASEYQAAFSPKTASEKRRYLPIQWAHGPQWETYSDFGDDWHGFFAARKLQGIDADVALIPLIGHTRGHSGIAVSSKDGWLLHGGDAYFFHKQIAQNPSCPKGLDLFQKLIAENDKARKANVARLRDLALSKSQTVQVISSHDPVEFDMLRTKENNREN